MIHQDKNKKLMKNANSPKKERNVYNKIIIYITTQSGVNVSNDISADQNSAVYTNSNTQTHLGETEVLFTENRKIISQCKILQRIAWVSLK